MPTTCPSEPDLIAFHLGHLPPDAVEQMGKHVADCRRCETFLEYLEGLSDTLVAGLRVGPPGVTTQVINGAATIPPGESARPLLPGYEVLGELGRGGMGVVYKARQVGLNRVVALKVVLGGGHAGPQALTRFRREAEAVAALRHPHIVQIHEIGEHDGLPYFSLEWMEGGSLDARLTGQPLPAREAAALIEPLARAVQHAHERGVVHRDLKPANVLLTADGTPKVTDFGLAKRLDAPGQLTVTGQVAGTPSYMAPEQVTGTRDVGPPADIHALGAILYELLTGRPTFRGAGVTDTLFQVQNLPPVPPSRLNPAVSRALETVCLKCLHKEPHKRYATAGDLADDLRRFLDGRPVSARPTPAWEVAWLWAKRRPAVAALTAFSLLVTAAGVGLVTWQWRAAVHNYHEAEQRKQEAVANFRLARDAVDRYLMKVSGHPGLRAAGGRALQKDLLEAAREFYARFVAERGDDPALASDLARAHRRLGVIAYQTGAHDVAINHFRQVLTLLESLIPAHPDDSTLVNERVGTLCDLGMTLHHTRQAPDALAAFKQGENLAEQLVAGHPDVLEFRETLRRLYNNLGIVHNDASQWEAAVTAHERAKDLGEALHRDRPQNPEYRLGLASTYNNLGTVQQRMAFDAGRQSVERGRAVSAAAVQSFERAKGILEELTKDQRKVPEEYQYHLASVATNLGGVFRAIDQPAAAARSFDTAREHFEKLVAVYPEVSNYQISLAATYDNLSFAANTAGKADECLAWSRKAIPILEAVRVQEPNNGTLLRVLRNASWNEAESLTKLGRHAEALPAWDRTIQVATGGARDELRLLRAQTLARAGDHAQAAAEAADVPEGPTPGYHQFLAAGVYALASAAVREDAALDASSRERQAEQYAGTALEWLGRARDRGYFKRADRLKRLHTSPNLDPLRGRADFRQFLASVTGDSPSG